RDGGGAAEVDDQGIGKKRDGARGPIPRAPASQAGQGHLAGLTIVAVHALGPLRPNAAELAAGVASTGARGLASRSSLSRHARIPRRAGGPAGASRSSFGGRTAE